MKRAAIERKRWARATRTVLRFRNHQVYWGSHGCYKDRSHIGKCRCSCGASTAVYGRGLARTYGDDAR